MSTHVMGSETAPSYQATFDADARSEGISRTHLHNELLVLLRNSIISGELHAGAKIPEKELCERFSVSRTPLREALKVLAFEGLVILNHNRGSVVKPMRLDDLSQAFPIYGRLEALAGEFACERLTPDEVEEIVELHERMVGCYECLDNKGGALASEQIHEFIQTGSRNRNLVQLIRSISGPIKRARTLLAVPAARLSSAMAEHERIVSALQRRDAPMLSQAIREHIENTFQSIKTILMSTERQASETNRSRRYGAAQPV